MELPIRLAEKLSKILGVESDEVLVGDSTSINLFKLASAAVAARNNRNILSDRTNFPSDLYVLNGVGNLALAPDPTGFEFSADYALASSSHLDFRSGRRYDLAGITASAHAADVWMIWDCSHSVGVVPLELGSTDMAVGCSYKYLNGGPGAPAWLYVRRELQSHLRNPIQGWLGSASPFAFDLEYSPAPDIARFQVSTPSVLSMTAMEAGIDLYLEASAELVWQKAVALTAFFMEATRDRFSFATPIEPEKRGGHVTITHNDGWRITQALIAHENVLPDFREPNCVRFAFSPLTTTFEDVAKSIESLTRVVDSKAYERFPSQKPLVT
jgi:kynureninase